MEFEKIHFLPAREKVKALSEKYPQLFTDFLDKDIASLVGMKKETFCRIKKQLGIK